MTEYLFKINDTLNGDFGLQKGEDVVGVVSNEMLEADEQFMQYVKRNNIEIGNNQLKYLKEVVKYLEDRELMPVDQADIRRRWDHSSREQGAGWGWEAGEDRAV